MRSSHIGKAAWSILLVSAAVLAGCTIPLKPPPQISYDDEAQLYRHRMISLPQFLRPVDGVDVDPEWIFPETVGIAGSVDHD